jgi:hypothetical protein
MNNRTTIASPEPKTPWHLWVVAILAILWNGSGAYTIMMAQAGRLADLTPDEAAYYAAQPTWFVVVTDIALVGAIAAAIALLFRSRQAVWLFAISLAAIFVTNAYDLAAGTSRALVSRGALIVTGIIVVLAILELVYARAMRKRAVLA